LTHDLIYHREQTRFLFLSTSLVERIISRGVCEQQTVNSIRMATDESKVCFLNTIILASVHFDMNHAGKISGDPKYKILFFHGLTSDESTVIQPLYVGTKD
jgi:hypothetical protein